MTHKITDIEIKKALDFFGLSIPINNKSEIKKAYKRLSMIHHPDRGGNENDFKTLFHYKNILEKNFYLLSRRSIELKDEIEELGKQEKTIYIGLKIRLKEVELGFFYYVDFILMFFLFLFTYIIKIGFAISLYGLLFIGPMVFLGKNTESINSSFKQEGYITDGVNIWHYSDEIIRYLGDYDEEFKNHNITIYGIEKLEERKKLLFEIFFTHLITYLVIILLFTTFYYLFLKMKIVGIMDNLNKRIGKIKLLGDFELRESMIYKKIILIIRIPKIYYFIGLYFSVYFISYFIYLIF